MAGWRGQVCAGVVALLLSPATVGAQTTITFASGPDDTGTVKRLVTAFNQAHEGKVEVEWKQMARESDAHRRQLVESFEGKTKAYDVVASDVVWTAEFATKRWVSDVTRRYYGEYEAEELLEPAVKSASYRLRMWGVPWYTDTSVLFYRKDLLAAAGVTAPPKTWDELETIAKTVKATSGTRYGFLFQGAAYEGGTANALEFIWSAGGSVIREDIAVTGVFGNTIFETRTVAVDSPETARGLDVAKRLITEDVAPSSVAGFHEKETLDAFLAGDAVFLRSWPYVFGRLEGSALSRDQVGVAAIPAASAKDVGYSCLGGWNLMIDRRASAPEQKAAWRFIAYLTDPAQQKKLALDAGLLPVSRALYKDADVVDRLPIVALGRDGAARVRVRPESPAYAELSARIANVFHRTLKGELDGAEAARLLDADLKSLLGHYR